MPLALTFALVSLSLLPRVQSNVVLTRSFWAAALLLLVWQVVLFTTVRRAGEGRAFTVVLRPQHYVQAMVQLSLYAYWGYYWRPVYEYAPLLAAQLVFAYAFDMLLAWSRGRSYVLGFGPFPILFSTNLFLWFRDDWFYLQFLMVGAGFLGKEFVRWQRDGARVHIFNPSAFSLGLFSLVLIATDTTHLTWAHEIATTLTFAPRIYLFLFLLGLVVMYFFSITLVAGSAAIVLFGSSALYAAFTGVPFFVNAEIPPAVFLGLHLLVTDPSTSPRTRLGKALFGILYGLGVFGLYALLGVIGAPRLYDKLLCVPLLNLSVQWIDALARSIQKIPALSRFGELRPARANAVHMAVWIAFFATMAAIGSTDGMHRGDSLPFWRQACAEGRRHACDQLLLLEADFCYADNSTWACNELGRHYTTGEVVEPDSDLAWRSFSQACEHGHLPACFNLLTPDDPIGTDPRVEDLRFLLHERGPTPVEMPERDLLARACRHGWDFACEGAS